MVIAILADQPYYDLRLFRLLTAFYPTTILALPPANAVKGVDSWHQHTSDPVSHLISCLLKIAKARNLNEDPAALQPGSIQYLVEVVIEAHYRAGDLTTLQYEYLTDLGQTLNPLALHIDAIIYIATEENIIGADLFSEVFRRRTRQLVAQLQQTDLPILEIAWPKEVDGKETTDRVQKFVDEIRGE